MFAVPRPKRRSEEDVPSVQVPVRGTTLPPTRRARQQRRTRRILIIVTVVLMSLAFLVFLFSLDQAAQPIAVKPGEELTGVDQRDNLLPDYSAGLISDNKAKNSPAPARGKPYKNPFDPNDTRTAIPEPQFANIFYQTEAGVYEPEEPHVVPGLTVHRRTFTPEELLEKFGDFSIIYSFVNGSEVNHYYRKAFTLSCTKQIKDAEKTFFDKVAALGDRVGGSAVVERDGETSDAEKKRQLTEAIFAQGPMDCRPKFFQSLRGNTSGALLDVLRDSARPDTRDRETDELKHSLRSVEQHISWHRGRITMVSPGHHPTWMDNAKNFLASVCGDKTVTALRARGTHLRLTTVHQDAVMPYGMRLTVDTNAIEPHLWRIKNTTAIHVYYNDDYFVNRPVHITDMLNEYGGTIVRTEKGLLRKGIRAKKPGGTWGEGVRNTHLVNIALLDAFHEDYLPPALLHMWSTLKRYAPVAPAEEAAGVGAILSSDTTHRVAPVVPPLDTYMEVYAGFEPEPLPDSLVPRRWRRYATHAPFVYCTNMWRFFEKRLEREFAMNSFLFRSRQAQDIYTPFVYNAFAMARPWAASPKYLPYLVQLAAHRQPGSAVPAPKVDIALDNEDGCGVSSLRGGVLASECIFAKFLDNMTHNQAVVKRIDAEVPLYFNINAGFSSDEACDYLREFLGRKFSTPIYLERGLEPVSDADRALPDVYAGLMGLPVIAVTSFAEGVCPMVRSLQLALPDHSGIVISAVARHGTDGDDAAADKTLSALRAEMLHRVRNAVPVSACAYNERVRPLRAAAPVPASREAALSDDTLLRIVRAALEEAGSAAPAAVALPDVCGYEGASRIRAIVLDGRTDVRDAMSLRHAVTMPGQSLALEDFEVVPVGDGSGDAVLVLSRQAADAKSVHWIDGAAESDLLLTYPIAYALYEDLEAPLLWSNMNN